MMTRAEASKTQPSGLTGVFDSLGMTCTLCKWVVAAIHLFYGGIRRSRGNNIAGVSVGIRSCEWRRRKLNHQHVRFEKNDFLASLSAVRGGSKMSNRLERPHQ